ncbi:BON domain-containing protein [Brumicola nitratireducens]|uniref:Transport-associated protein n=1 Tax=Glaciecola nitratireducens (strain JCM 12485 / KCTC 12276 / FR1064) TaxID=1085623 RepID=G4QJ12_GLANF|nr:BON domain-containing protein [Glaciecola nitratireducens]AEP28880.1 transport-associated protein [Glaciecola nitratireducens FR1064]
MFSKGKFATILIIFVAFMQSGCALMAVGTAGAAATASATDRRTVGTQIDDKTTQSRVRSAINDIPLVKDEAAVSVDVYNGQVLLTGQAPLQRMIIDIENSASTVQNVTKVHNQIRLGSPIPATSTMNDVWLASKIKTIMLADEQIPLFKLDLIVEDSEVFIMGLLTKQEAAAAVEAARNVDGVTKVIRVMELIR